MEMADPILDVIRSRRSVLRFEEKQVDEKLLENVLEAGRWAPSWLNKQPWIFIVVADKNIKTQLSSIVPTVFVQGLKEAPVCIAVAVDTTEDPYHYIEDGAVATQNMALAAQGLGLSSCWIGIFDLKSQKKSAEARARDILELPKTYRVISLLPVGYARGEVPEKDRRMLFQMVFKNKFGSR
jgi:nitroreductase